MRPLRQRFESNIKVHYDLEDLRPGLRLQYRRMLLMVTAVWTDTFQGMALVENGGLPLSPAVRKFDRTQLVKMRRPPKWLLHQYEEVFSHD